MKGARIWMLPFRSKHFPHILHETLILKVIHFTDMDLVNYLTASVNDKCTTKESGNIFLVLHSDVPCKFLYDDCYTKIDCVF